MFHIAERGKALGMARRYGSNEAARTVALIADAAAVVIGLWIALYVLKANPANLLVTWVHHAADWLAAWSRDLFTPAAGWLRTLINYGLAAVVYLLLGHAAAGRIRRI